MNSHDRNQDDMRQAAFERTIYLEPDTLAAIRRTGTFLTDVVSRIECDVHHQFAVPGQILGGNVRYHGCCERLLNSVEDKLRSIH